MMVSMSAFRKVVLVCAVALPMLAVVGCGTSLVPPEVSALAKIGTGQMNTLSGTEIKAVADTFVPGSLLTDPQADAIAQFLSENDIATIADAQALVAKFVADPTSVKLPDGFLELFKDFQLPTGGTGQPA